MIVKTITDGDVHSFSQGWVNGMAQAAQPILSRRSRLASAQLLISSELELCTNDTHS